MSRVRVPDLALFSLVLHENEDNKVGDPYARQLDERGMMLLSSVALFINN
jgi:hypothetical protein